MQTFKKILLVLILAIIVLCVAAYAILKVTMPPAKIRALVHQYGSEALNRDMSIGDASIRLFPNLKVSVEDVKVANAPGFSADPAVSLRELALSIDVLSLLRLSPTIHEIKLVEPTINYEVNPDGHNNLEGLGKKDSAKAVKDTVASKPQIPGAVALKRFAIVDGAFHYRDRKQGQEIALDKINQSVSLDLDPALEHILSQGKLEIRQIQVSDRKSGLRKGGLRVSLDHDLALNLKGEDLRLNSLKLGFQDVAVEAKGQVSRFLSKPLSLDLAYASNDIHLGSILKEIPASLSPDLAKLSASGTAKFSGHMAGQVDSGKIPHVLFDLQVRDGAFKHADLPAAITAFNADIHATEDSLRVSRLGFSADQAPVSLTALLTDLRKTPILQALALDATVDLGKLMPLLGKMGAAPESLSLAGMVKANLKANGKLDPKDPTAIKAEGLVTLQDVKVVTPKLPDPLAASGKVQINNEKITEDLAAKLGPSDLQVDATVSNYLAMALPKLAGGAQTVAKATIRSDFLDLDRLLGGPKDTAKPAEQPPMQAFPSLPKLDATADLKVAKAQYFGMALTDFSALATIRNGVLTLDSKGKAFSGSLGQKLAVDLKDTTDAKVALALNVSQVQANDFLNSLGKKLATGNGKLVKTFAKADNTLFGKLNLDADLKTHGLPQTMADNLTGAINFNVNDGKLAETGLVRGLSDALAKVSPSLALHEMNFGLFHANLQAQAGKLLVKDCKLDRTPVGALAATGGIGFDNVLDLSIEQHLPAAISQALRGATGAATSALAQATHQQALANVSLYPMDKAGQAILYFLVGGSVTKPAFSLDKARMASESKAGVQSALKAELDKQKAALQAKADAEKAKVEAEAKARADAEKQKLQEQANQKKQQATEAAKQQGKKVLKGLGL